MAQGAVRCIVVRCAPSATPCPLTQAICARNPHLLSRNPDIVVGIVQKGGVQVISFLVTELHNQRVRMDSAS